MIYLVIFRDCRVSRRGDRIMTAKFIRFAIFKMIDPGNVVSDFEHYKIVETTNTSDGPRSRLADGFFTTLEAALADVKRRVEQ